jgi:hypothetical protein
MDVEHIRKLATTGSERNIAITGVMPLPAVRNSSFGGVGDANVNSPSTSPRVTIEPAA